MNQAASAPHVSFEDYFEVEVSAAAGEPKHEGVDGVVYAASRETPDHGRLVSSVGIELGRAPPDERRVHASDTGRP